MPLHSIVNGPLLEAIKQKQAEYLSVILQSRTDHNWAGVPLGDLSDCVKPETSCVRRTTTYIIISNLKLLEYLVWGKVFAELTHKQNPTEQWPENHPCVVSAVSSCLVNPNAEHISYPNIGAFGPPPWSLHWKFFVSHPMTASSYWKYVSTLNGLCFSWC